MKAIKSNIQIRRDSKANWEQYNPILSEGEFGFETETGLLKIGDGSSDWNSLQYYGYPEIIDLTGATEV